MSGPVGRGERDEPGAGGGTGQHRTGGGPEPAGTGEDQQPGAAELLAEMRALRRRTRTARHAYWFPFVIIAAGLWVLARAERSLALAVIAAAYTATALLSNLYNIENVLFRFGWNAPGSDWSPVSLPNVLLPALVLLAAGAGAFAAQRRHRART